MTTTAGLRQEKLDEKDFAILEALIEDGRASFKQIAARTGLPDSTVQYRVGHLVKSGVIENFTAHVNLKKLGFDLEATIGMSVEPQHIESVARSLAAFPEVYSVWIVAGAHNISCRAAFRDEAGMARFTDRLNGMKNVTTYHLSIVTKKAKSWVGADGLKRLVLSAETQS
jgi:Lrp/AsnC family transcriptional regulator, regulator for asnA, asnC and gidA